MDNLILYFGNNNRIVKIFSVVFCVLLLPIIFGFNTQTAKADSKVNYYLITKNCDSNKSFEVDVVAEGDTSLSAADITVIYDVEDLEYNSVQTANENIEIEKNENIGKIETLILCHSGYRFSGKAKLMTFKFKALSSDSTEIKLFVNDVVDNDCKSVSIGSVYNSSISINESGSLKATSIKSSNNLKEEIEREKSEKKSSKKSEEKSEMEKITKPKNIDNDEEKTDTEIIADEYYGENSSGFSNLDDSAQDFYKYIIGGMIIAMLVLFFVCFYMFGRNKQLNNQKDKDEDE